MRILCGNFSVDVPAIKVNMSENKNIFFAAWNQQQNK